jgi:hypothetical protein
MCRTDIERVDNRSGIMIAGHGSSNQTKQNDIGWLTRTHFKQTVGRVGLWLVLSVYGS